MVQTKTKVLYKFCKYKREWEIFSTIKHFNAKTIYKPTKDVL